MSYSFAESMRLHARAVGSIAGGVNSGIRRLERPCPLYFQRGRGARLWDVDNNEYIDYQLSQGALFWGHAPEGFSASLAAQAELGVHWAAQCQLEIEVAERLRRFMPAMERVRFCCTATEAVATAFRLARAYTRRPLILRFEGHYHGWSDEGLVGFAPPPDRWGSENEPARLHPSEGVIPAVLDQFVVARWNDPDHLLSLTRRHRDSLAAIVCEPILCNTSCIAPTDGLVAALRSSCDESGALLIADETITGLRFGPGGAQAELGFIPDLTVMGKALGGGVPFAAVGGRTDVMDKIARGEVVHSGTLNGNPLCLAASAWCLEAIGSGGTGYPRELNALGERLMSGLRELARQHATPLLLQGPGLVFHTGIAKPDTSDRPFRDYRDFVLRHDAARWADLRLCLLGEGVRAIERGLWFLSLAHRENDIDETLKRAERAFRRHTESWLATCTRPVVFKSNSRA